MYCQCNIHKFYVLPAQYICVFCVDLRTNSDYFPTQYSPVVLRNAARQEVNLHSLLTSELSTSSQRHASAALPPAQKGPLNRRPDGAHSRSGRSKRRENFVGPTDSWTPFAHPTYTHSQNRNRDKQTDRHRQKCTERLTKFLYCNF
jgi:hypothetical protein